MNKKCETCRFWSEMCAQSIGCGPIEALCLSADSPKHSKFVRANYSCAAWRDNEFGAVDSHPDFGDTAIRMYQEREAWKGFPDDAE